MPRFAQIAAIGGVAESDLGMVAPKTSLQLQAEAAREALEECGLSFEDVDALFAAGREEYQTTVELAEYLGITPRYSDSTNVGGASSVAHVAHASAAIACGLCEVALVTYGSTQRSLRARALGALGAQRGRSQFDGVWGLPSPVGAYALAAMRHMHEYGTTPEQLAEVAVAARSWAALNPKAFARDELTVADVLASPPIAEPLHRLDCCLVTDGGGAVVVVSAERARDLPKPAVWIAGYGQSQSHLSIASMPDLTTTVARHSGPAAMSMAGVTHADIDVAQIYDSFTITVLMSLEALGFCGLGESGAFVQGGRIGPGGDFPLNTNGGGLSYCHPGMYGIFLLIEATRQVRGECGPRQVPDAKIALCNGTGGILGSTATAILIRD